MLPTTRFPYCYPGGPQNLLSEREMQLVPYARQLLGLTVGLVSPQPAGFGGSEGAELLAEGKGWV